MLKILDKIVYIVSLIAAFGLIGAYLSPIINPNTFVFFSLLGLAYPYLLIGNFILLLYWIFRWKRRTWQIVVVIAIGYPTFRTYYGTAKTETGDASYDLSLLSYNIRYFDVYAIVRLPFSVGPDSRSLEIPASRSHPRRIYSDN